MTTLAHSLCGPRRSIGWRFLLLAALAASAGCSTSQSTNGDPAIVNHILPSGKSVDGWMVAPSGGTHASSATLDYIGNAGSSNCAQCHGSDLAGGISAVSCFSNAARGCHHVTAPGTPAWDDPQVHGATAKKAPGSSGFASCQICHGGDFSGGGSGVSCFSCHATSPHPADWKSGDRYRHDNTATGNAAACAVCHRSAAGTPGCFNNTLCHGEGAVPHPVGIPAWYATPPGAQVHGTGPNGAKAAPSPTAGFLHCQGCHGSGTDFAGGTAGVSCTNNPDAACHGSAVASPHPRDWLPGDSYVHTSTAEGNAAVCADCHRSAAGTPGCFNNTLCHGAGGAPHPVPFSNASHYGVDAATYASNCSGCHDVPASPPTSKVGPPCRTCHVASSPLTAGSCTSCHASPPDSGAPAGAAYPNLAGTHAVHLSLNGAGSPVSCVTCHNGLTSGTDNHYNRANNIPGENAQRIPPGDAAFPATYNAKTGATSFLPSALTCTNVSCHGGTTPNWQSSVIDVNSQCGICHAQGTAQYNSYNSGEHGINTAHNTCGNCHNTATLAANHFTNLSTPAMEGPASATIGGGTTKVSSYVAGTGSCTPATGSGCHGNRDWFGN
jgi:predicted CxxxxCH...CXXCH cytochrome family protein